MSVQRHNNRMIHSLIIQNPSYSSDESRLRVGLREVERLEGVLLGRERRPPS